MEAALESRDREIAPIRGKPIMLRGGRLVKKCGSVFRGSLFIMLCFFIGFPAVFDGTRSMPTTAAFDGTRSVPATAAFDGTRSVPATWMPEVNLPICTAENAQHFPVLTSIGEDGVIVAWRDARNGNHDIYAQRVNQKGEIAWTPNGIPICKHPAFQSDPTIVHDLRGGAIVVWGDMRNGKHDSFAQRINPDGEKLWDPEGAPVCTNPALQSDFTAIADGNGGVIVVWEDWRAGNQDIYAQKISADGQPVWKQDGIAVYRGEGDQYDPALISDGTGGAIFVWWDISPPDWNVFAQRIDSSGNVVWDLPIPVCTAPGNQGAPTIVSNGNGGAFCVWSDYRNDPNSYTTAQLYAQHIAADGTTLWQKDGIPICEPRFNQQQPSCISDGEGGFIVTWWDDRDIFADIYAQRVNTSGKVLWNATGVPVCTAGGVQQVPMLVSDGAGGAIAYWLDYREDFGNTTEDAIYAQRINAEGKPLWKENGVPICTAKKEQITPKAVPLGIGGAIVVWSDARAGNNDIYIHYVQ